VKIQNWNLTVGSKDHTKYSQEDAQLSGKLDGLGSSLEKTQYMMAPQDLRVFFSTWKNR
jgi:hypothetical protein